MKTLSSSLPTSLVSALAVLLLAAPASAQTSLDRKQTAGKPIPPGALAPPAPTPPAGPPPVGPIHCVAEWEESEGILTLWKNADLIQKLQADHLVYIPVDDAAQEAEWIAFLQGAGVPLTNVDFLYIQTDSIYTRDYGPWFVWDGNDDLGIVNYTCSYGPWDDLFPSAFAALYGIAYYESGLDHVGGNYYPNAYGRAFSSTYVYGQNKTLTKAETDLAMLTYYGIERYQTVAPRSIWHHDTWGKPADPETLVLAQFPAGDRITHAQAEGMVAYYETLQSPWGRPYEIHRLPMFPIGSEYVYRPYMNSLVSNEQVFVPVHLVPEDALALQVFQDAFEGYEVVGVDATHCIWFDALHCRTRNFVRRDAIRVYPMPPGDTEDTSAGYRVTAEVIPPKGSALLASYPKLFWTVTGGAPFHELVMTPIGPREYAADIPPAGHGTTVEYYLEARDDAGRSALYPLVAPDGMLSFEVRADVEAPVLSRHVPVRSVAAAHWPPAVRTLCKDDMALPTARLEYAIDGVPQPAVSLAQEEACYWFEGALGGSVSPGDVVTYRLHAEDGAAAANGSALPLLGSYYLPVREAVDVGVVNLCSRPYTAPFLMDALGDLDVPYQAYTAWPTDWSEHDVWFLCLGVFADNHVLSAAEVADVAAALAAGKRVYLEGGDTWCTDPEKATLHGLFAVGEVADVSMMPSVEGVDGTLTAGLALDYAGEDLGMDVIEAVGRGELILRSFGDKGRAVLLDAPAGHRTIASTFALGGLLDGSWPDTRKELLVRYLAFLGVEGVQLSTATAVSPGETAPVRLEGAPGDAYVLVGSLAEHFIPTDLGVVRLDPQYLAVLAQGVVPPSGIVELSLPIPSGAGAIGHEVHLQAAVGSQLAPGQATLTNRDILSIVE